MALDAVGNLGEVSGARVGLSPVMIGRSAAFEQLVDLIDDSLAGCGELPTVALISGEAGIGKTRLTREVVAGFPAVAMVSAGADPGDVTRPLAMIGRLLRGRVAPLPEDVDTAVAAVIVATTGPAGGIVVIEDLHWIDAESASVLDRLTQTMRGDLVLVLTYRPEELSRRLPGGDLILRLERRQRVDRLHLDRLSRPEVGLLLGAVFGRPPSPAVVDAIHERTGGNPFVIEELARSCGDSCPDDLTTVSLPWSLAEVVAGQLEGLSADEVAKAAGTVSYELLCALAPRVPVVEPA